MTSQLQKKQKVLKCCDFEGNDGIEKGSFWNNSEWPKIPFDPLNSKK